MLGHRKKYTYNLHYLLKGGLHDGVSDTGAVLAAAPPPPSVVVLVVVAVATTRT